MDVWNSDQNGIKFIINVVRHHSRLFNDNEGENEINQAAKGKK